MDARMILEGLYAQFPGLDPRSAHFGDDVNGADLVDWITAMGTDIVDVIEG